MDDSVGSGDDYEVGDRLLLSSDVWDARVSRVTVHTVFLEWPWMQIDPGSRSPWDGTFGFPRRSDHFDWANTPWRIEPDVEELSQGDVCMIAVLTTEVRVMSIERYEPPADLGWLPRPQLAIGVCPVDLLGDDEAGYVLYIASAEPIVIEKISGD